MSYLKIPLTLFRNVQNPFCLKLYSIWKEGKRKHLLTGEKGDFPRWQIPNIIQLPMVTKIKSIIYSKLQASSFFLNNIKDNASSMSSLSSHSKKEYPLPTHSAFSFEQDSASKTGREPAELPNKQQHLPPRCQV